MTNNRHRELDDATRYQRIGGLFFLAAIISCAATPVVDPAHATMDTPVAQAEQKLEVSTLGATDCHMHIREHADSGAQDAASALVALHDAGLSRGCLLSAGYQRPSGCEDWRCGAQQEHTRQANDWTLTQANSDPGLLGFCGIPVGPPWAPNEINRCATAGSRGIKLHLVSQNLSLIDTSTAHSLSKIAVAAAANGQPILIHIAHQNAEEIERFFDVAQVNPNTTFIVAHGLLANLQMLAVAPNNVLIEISGLTFAPKSAGPGFVAAWRQFGMDRVLLGSDWPTMGLHAKTHLEWLVSFPLTDEEHALIIQGNAERIFPTNHERSSVAD